MVKTNENNAYRRGQELLDQGMYKEAIAQFDEAIKEQPESWKALNSKGFALQKLSRYTEAVECFDKALELNPQSVEVINNKGVTLSMRGLYKDAIAQFDQAVAIDPTSLEALNGKAIALQHMYMYKEALDVLEQAMKIDNRHTLLKQPCTIDTGNYMMVTGTRMASGKVLATLTFFSVKENATTPLELKIRESIDDIQVIGEFNSENLYQRMEDGKNVSLLSTTGRGYYVVAILKARQEPTNHALRDIATMKNELEQWGRGMVLLLPNEQEWKNFNPEEFGTLPSTITYGIDIDGKIQKEITANLKLKESELPIFIIADTFNRVVFVSQGYTIGLGEQLMKVIHKL